MGKPVCAHVSTHTLTLTGSLNLALHFTCRLSVKGCSWSTLTPWLPLPASHNWGWGNLVPPHRWYKPQEGKYKSGRQGVMNSDQGIWEILRAESHQAGTRRMNPMSRKCWKEGELTKSLEVQKFKDVCVCVGGVSHHLSWLEYRMLCEVKKEATKIY